MIEQTKIVIDTSIIISILVDEVDKPIIVDKTKGCELYAPVSVFF